jgi:capsular exopolysaccharide synthesis family protein
MPQEGKTFTSLNLGAAMALGEDRKVLVIDCNLRRPCVALALGMGKAPGLTDVIDGKTSLEQAIQPTRVPNLSVLCAGPVPKGPADLLGGRKLQEILDACSERFDWILIDSPPAAMVVDPAILAKLCDGAIVVARSSRTTYLELGRALRALADVGATLLGVVLNGTRESETGYGHGYGYGDGSRPLPRARAAVAAPKPDV